MTFPSRDAICITDDAELMNHETRIERRARERSGKRMKAINLTNPNADDDCPLTKSFAPFFVSHSKIHNGLSVFPWPQPFPTASISET